MTGLCTELDERIAGIIRKLARAPNRIHVDVQNALLIVEGSATADESCQICASLRRLPGIDEVENRVQIIEQ